jgi:hypothetical protein
MGAQDAMKGSFGEDALQGVDGEDEEHGRQRVALAKTPLMAERADGVTIQNTLDVAEASERQIQSLQACPKPKVVRTSRR